jgi:uncharacterized coiled-coil DUF342 family protein
MRKLIDEKKRLFEQSTKLREDLKKKTGETQEAKEKMPYRTVGEMEQRIRQLEMQIETGQFKLIEEKQILGEISKLNKLRRTLESIDHSTSNDVTSMKLRLDKFRTQIAEKDELINAAKAQVEEITKKLDQMNGVRAEAATARADRSAAIEKHKKELGTLYEERRAAQQEYFAAKKAQFEAREKRDAKRAEYERRQALQEKLEDLEEQLLAFNPETATDKKICECNNIKAFFSELVGTTTSAASNQQSDNSVNGVNAVDPKLVDGIRKVKLSSDLAQAEVIKKDDDAFFFAPKKKGSSNGVQSTAAPPAGSVPQSLSKKMPYHILSGLADLNLPIPSTPEDVPKLFKAIEDLKNNWCNKKDEGKAEMEQKREKLKAQIEELKKEIEKPIKIEKKSSADATTEPDESAEK